MSRPSVIPCSSLSILHLFSSLFIDLLGIEDPFAHHGDLVLIQPPKEAAFIAFVTSRVADLADRAWAEHERGGSEELDPDRL